MYSSVLTGGSLYLGIILSDLILNRREQIPGHAFFGVLTVLLLLSLEQSNNGFAAWAILILPAAVLGISFVLLFLRGSPNEPTPPPAPTAAPAPTPKLLPEPIDPLTNVSQDLLNSAVKAALANHPVASILNDASCIPIELPESACKATLPAPTPVTPSCPQPSTPPKPIPEVTPMKTC